MYPEDEEIEQEEGVVLTALEREDLRFKQPLQFKRLYNKVVKLLIDSGIYYLSRIQLEARCGSYQLCRIQLEARWDGIRG